MIEGDNNSCLGSLVSKNKRGVLQDCPSAEYWTFSFFERALLSYSLIIEYSTLSSKYSSISELKQSPHQAKFHPPGHSKIGLFFIGTNCVGILSFRTSA